MEISFATGVLPALLPFLVFVSGLWWLVLQMRFEISGSHVEVRLFGWRVRGIALSDIEYADRSWCWVSEHYNTTLDPRRVVRIRRRSGLNRNFVITPSDPAAFLVGLAGAGVEIR